MQSSDFELIFKLIQIYQDFAQRRDWLIQHELGQAKTVEYWLKQLMQDLSEFQDAGVDVLASVFSLVQKHDRMLTLASYFDAQSGQDLRQLSLPLDVYSRRKFQLSSKPNSNKPVHRCHYL